MLVPLLKRKRCDGDHELRLTAMRGPEEGPRDVIIRLIELETRSATKAQSFVFERGASGLNRPGPLRDTMAHQRCPPPSPLAAE